MSIGGWIPLGSGVPTDTRRGVLVAVLLFAMFSVLAVTTAAERRSFERDVQRSFERVVQERSRALHLREAGRPSCNKLATLRFSCSVPIGAPGRPTSYSRRYMLLATEDACWRALHRPRDLDSLPNSLRGCAKQ
jgi:hypothetical protein